MLPDQHLVFTTESGLAIVDTQADQSNHLAPPVHIEAIEADAKGYPLASQVSGRFESMRVCMCSFHLRFGEWHSPLQCLERR